MGFLCVCVCFLWAVVCGLCVCVCCLACRVLRSVWYVVWCLCVCLCVCVSESVCVYVCVRVCDGRAPAPPKPKPPYHPKGGLIVSILQLGYRNHILQHTEAFN